jgi:hypothetical protein
LTEIPEHLDRNLVPIEVGSVIAHGGEGGINIGVVTRLTEHKIEIKRFCVDMEHIPGEDWSRENYMVTGYYWGKTMLNSADRCMVLPMTEQDIVMHFLMAHRIGEVLPPHERTRNITEIPSDGTIG